MRETFQAFARSWRQKAREMAPELAQGIDNLRSRKMRSLLTMLGMIFGVGAVVAMLSIGAGAQQEVIAFIEQLGVRNVIVEARESPDSQTLEKVRKLSAGLTLQDLRSIEANLSTLAAPSPRKRVIPMKMLPKPQAEMPVVYGVSPAYASISGLRVSSGRFFDGKDGDAGAVAVLGQAAAASLFGTDDPIGRFVKVNQQWFRVIGIAGPQLAAQTDMAGLPAQDRTVIYVPLRGHHRSGRPVRKDEIDGIYLRCNRGDVTTAGAIVRGCQRRTGGGDQRLACGTAASSAARSASSRWSWSPSPRSRCWSAASAS
jgi:putative ABC transport system permease protein